MIAIISKYHQLKKIPYQLIIKNWLKNWLNIHGMIPPKTIASNKLNGTRTHTQLV